MGFLSWILRRPKKAEALQIASQSLQIDSSERFKSLEALQSDQIDKENYGVEAILETPQLSPSVPIQKDSLQLGFAAGYTGKTLKEIESSLSRIEHQMISRDWFSSEFEDKTPELIQMMNIHEENEQKRFEAIQNILHSLRSTAERAPEPLKTEMMERISSIEMQMPLTPKMKELLQTTKESKEISYDDLSTKLDIGVSALRGLLSNMVKRTKDIERFEKDGKGWVKYTGNWD
jgi:hypothetical protein